MVSLNLLRPSLSAPHLYTFSNGSASQSSRANSAIDSVALLHHTAALHSGKVSSSIFTTSKLAFSLIWWTTSNLEASASSRLTFILILSIRHRSLLQHFFHYAAAAEFWSKNTSANFAWGMLVRFDLLQLPEIVKAYSIWCTHLRRRRVRILFSSFAALFNPACKQPVTGRWLSLVLAFMLLLIL